MGVMLLSSDTLAVDHALSTTAKCRLARSVLDHARCAAIVGSSRFPWALAVHSYRSLHDGWLRDLHKQATAEQRYYDSQCVMDAIKEIERLRRSK